MVTEAMKLKDACSLIKIYDKPRQHIKKQRLYFANKGPSNQSYGFSSNHVWMWELGHKESWVLKNWCFWTVVLEKTLESPLDCKEIQQVHPKGDQSWIFIGRTDAETETPILWPPDAKSWLIGKDPDAGKDWRQEEKGRTEGEMVGWHHQLNGHMSLSKLWVMVKFRETPPWSHKESDTTEQLNNQKIYVYIIYIYIYISVIYMTDCMISIPLYHEIFIPCFMSLDMFQWLLVYSLWELE